MNPRTSEARSLRGAAHGRGCRTSLRMRTRARRWGSPFGTVLGRYAMETDRLTSVVSILPTLDMGRVLTRLEGHAPRPHPLEGASVVITDFPPSWDVDAHGRALKTLAFFIRAHGLIRINSGVRPEGYVVRLRTPEMAETFRRHWSGETVSPIALQMLGRFDLTTIAAEIAALEFA